MVRIRALPTALLMNSLSDRQVEMYQDPVEFVFNRPRQKTTRSGISLSVDLEVLVNSEFLV